VQRMPDFATEPLRIGLDARTVFAPRPRGTGRNLRDAYQVLGPLCSHWSFSMYHRGRDVGQVALPANLRSRRLRMPGDRWEAWLQLRLPLAAWMDRLDLLHLPANVGLWRIPTPMIVTIHDLAPLHESHTSEMQRDSFEHGVKLALQHAVRIITPSQATREELCRRYDYPLERVSVIGWAADERVVQQHVGTADLERVRQCYKLDRPWLLNFSGSSPRKNADGIVRALAHVPREQREAFVVLLVGCEPVERRESLIALAGELGVDSDIRMHGFAPLEDLAPLLRGAAGLMLPSFCEGFGLPILDAMACGTPVLTSNLSSMPEVAGEAALYCNPHDPASIARGMVELLEPATRADLRAAGAKRSEQFSWQVTANLMAEAYATAVADARSGRFAKKLQPAMMGGSR
jgi:glycosyltransferase involved in cell wall biosynthesis